MTATTPNGTPVEDLDGLVPGLIAAAVGLDADEVTPESRLVTDLGAESLDMLDILFRIEKSTGVKIQMAEITSNLQGDLSNEDIVTAEGYVSEEGLAQLKSALPQTPSPAVRVPRSNLRTGCGTPVAETWIGAVAVSR